MSKRHRDNHQARLKRGNIAFAKKAKRRKPDPRCSICGTHTQKLENGWCMVCRGLRPDIAKPWQTGGVL